jgi:hypothetical protein
LELEGRNRGQVIHISLFIRQPLQITAPDQNEIFFHCRYNKNDQLFHKYFSFITQTSFVREQGIFSLKRYLSQGANQTRRGTKYEGARTGTQNKLGCLMKDNPMQK